MELSVLHFTDWVASPARLYPIRVGPEAILAWLHSAHIKPAGGWQVSLQYLGYRNRQNHLQEWSLLSLISISTPILVKKGTIGLKMILFWWYFHGRYSNWPNFTSKSKKTSRKEYIEYISFRFKISYWFLNSDTCQPYSAQFNFYNYSLHNDFAL